MLETLQQIDASALVAMRSWIDPTNQFVVSVVRYSADIEVIAMALVLVTLWLYGRVKKDNTPKEDALFMFYLIVFGFGFYLFVSMFLTHRMRPEEVTTIAPLITKLPDNSFPSGHAIFAGASLVGAWLCGRKQLFSLLLVLAILMLLARVFAGVHYPGDILAGLLLGAVVAYTVAPLANESWYKKYLVGFPILIASKLGL